LAVFFFALTTKIDPLLTDTQRWVVLLALALMAVSAFAGLWSAWSDARWSYSWGREVENRADDMSFWEVEKDRWHRRKLWGERWCLGAFVAGILVAAGYVALRAFGI
jgi:Kef-type K+ transport system membrane component KefB